MGIEIRVEQDQETDITCLRFTHADEWPVIATSAHVELEQGPGLVLDFNTAGQLVTIEFLDRANLPPGSDT